MYKDWFTELQYAHFEQLLLISVIYGNPGSVIYGKPMFNLGLKTDIYNAIKKTDLFLTFQ